MSAAFADFPVKARQVEADFTKSGLCLNIFLEPLNLPQAARYLLDKGYFLEDVTGLDLAEGLAGAF